MFVYSQISFPSPNPSPSPSHFAQRSRVISIIQVNIVDSVLLDDGNIVNYVYTGKDGCLKVKPRTHFVLMKVRNEFAKIAAALQGPDATNIALLHREECEPSPLNYEGLNSICTGATPMQPLVLQCFVPSKGNPSSFRTFRFEIFFSCIIHNAKCLE